MPHLDLDVDFRFVAGASEASRAVVLSCQQIPCWFAAAITLWRIFTTSKNSPSSLKVNGDDWGRILGEQRLGNELDRAIIDRWKVVARAATFGAPRVARLLAISPEIQLRKE